MRLVTSVMSLLLVLGMSLAAQTGSTPSIRGVWKVTEVTTPDGRNSTPQPAMYIFTERHYNILQINGDQPRPVQSLQNATRDELLAAWGSFGAHGGTYALRDGQLTVQPTVAKAPVQMRPGTSIQYGVTFEGPILVLTAAGQVRTTYKLARLE